MKIAIFHNLPGGGSVRYINQVIKDLLKSNIVDIFTITEDSRQLISNTNKLLDFPESKIIVNPFKGFIFRNFWIFACLKKEHKKLAKKINNENYELVIVNHDYFTKSPFILRYIKAEKIYILHEPPREFYENSDIFSPNIKYKIINFLRLYIKVIDKINTKKSNYIVCNSKYSKDIIKKIYNRKACIIYPKIDETKFNNNKSIKRKRQILLVGSLKKYKGHYFVVKSLKKIIEDKGYSVLIIGKGSKKDKNIIMSCVTRKDRTKIKIIEDVSDKLLIKSYKESKILCIGAHNEPFGMSSIEAQACGTPVVAISEGGLRETIIQGETGFVTPRDRNSFLNKVQEVLDNWTKFSNNSIDMSKKWNNKKSIIHFLTYIKNSK